MFHMQVLHYLTSAAVSYIFHSLELTLKLVDSIDNS